MAARIIEKYVAAWHPEEDYGGITLYLGNGDKKTWRIQTGAEFLAILQILQKDPVSFLTENGWISTGKEDPGGLKANEVATHS